MKPYYCRRGNMPYYVRCTWANGYVSELMVADRFIDFWGTSPRAATEYMACCISLRKDGIIKAEVCDSSGPIGSERRA